MIYIEYMLEMTTNMIFYIVYQLKGSSVREFLQFGTHPKQKKKDRKKIDKK